MTCILTIIKNEQLYLDEWIRYHLGLGIDHIFIIEDFGSDSHQSITDNYDQATILQKSAIFSPSRLEEVTTDKMKGLSVQNDLFRAGLNYIKQLGYDWCITMDVDEFITFKRGYDINVINEFNDYDAICLQWQNYGASKRKKMPDYSRRSIMECYPKRCCFDSFDMKMFHRTCKTFWNMRTYKEVFFQDSHVPRLCKWCKTDFTQDQKSYSYDRFYLRHYITKSWEEYLNKLLVRGMFWTCHRSVEDFFIYNPDMLDDKDKMMEQARKLQLSQNRTMAVIIYCHNNGEAARETIASIRRNALRSLIGIVINDGSTDNTEAVIREELGSGLRLVLQSHPYKGIAASVKEAIEMTDTEYITCLYAPDYVKACYTNRGVEYMDAHPECSLYYTNKAIYSKPVQHINLSEPQETFLFRRKDYEKLKGMDVSSIEFRKALMQLGTAHKNEREHHIIRQNRDLL